MMSKLLLSAVKNHFWQFVSAVLFVIILVQRGCDTENPKSITKLDPKPFVFPVKEYVPTPIVIPQYVDTGSTNWKIKYEEQKIDTAKIMELYREYFSYKLYKDTIHCDTNGMVIVSDSISENKIMGRKVEGTFYPSIYTIATPPSRKFFVGIGMGGYNNKFGMSGKVLFIDKKDRIYGLSYNPILQYFEASTYWKIKLKK